VGPEFSDAECRRESRQALTGSTAITGMMKVKITPNFSFAGKGQLREASVCMQRNAALARQAVGERKCGRGAWRFCSSH